MKARLAVLILAPALFLAACSTETRSSIETDLRNAGTDVVNAVDSAADDATEAVARNVATQQGEQQFKDTGHELDGPLTCEAEIEAGRSNVTINCTGTTKTGEAAALTGATAEIPGASVVELEGEFTGTVNGTQVFTTQRLGG